MWGSAECHHAIGDSQPSGIGSWISLRWYPTALVELLDKEAPAGAPGGLSPPNTWAPKHSKQAADVNRKDRNPIKT